MPSNVVWFERLMIASVVIGLVGVLLFWRREATATIADFAIATALLVVNFGLMLLVIWLIARRKLAWLRYVLAALFALGVYGGLPRLPEELRALPIEGSLGLLQLVLQGVALVLVFTGNARAWFAKPKPLAPP